MTNEFLGFITPQFELLQLSFLTLILAMFFGTIISTQLNAKDESWNKNWNNGTIEDNRDNLDIDHGSVTDLWNAVATKSEKLAEIMPGMLLVVGLLGTFLGLGMALNHASNILGQPSTLSATGAASSMQDLMSMMQGLGTKFKTSTWGIAFFLLFKVWSSWKGYEEKRLTWVIRKVKKELEYRKAQEREAASNKQQTLFTQITQAASNIINGFADNLEKMSASQQALHLQNLHTVGQAIKTIHGDFDTINNNMRSDSAALKHMLEQSMQGIHEDLVDSKSSIQNASAAIRQTLEQDTKSTHEDLISIKSSMKTDIAAIKQTLEKNSKDAHGDLVNITSSMQSASTAIKQTLEKTTEIVCENLLNIKLELQNDSAAINQTLEQSTQGVREDLANIKTATQNSSEAMVGFVSSTQAIINGMSAASSKMADGAHEVGIAGSSLVKAVDDFSTQFTQVLGEVRTNLSSAINNMSAQAAQTLEKGTAELGKATLEISAALGVLSRDVTTTMNGVKDSIDKSLQIQERGGILFKNSSDTLNENVTATTELVEKLGEDILSGLQAVSDSGRRMVSIGKSLETIVPQMADLLPALEPLKTLHIHNQPLLDETKGLRTDFLKLDSRKELQSEKSMKIQQESAAIIQKTADRLNDSVTATTASVKKLGDDVINGLQVASETGLKISSIEDSIKKFLLEMNNLRNDIAALPKIELPINHYSDTES